MSGPIESEYLGAGLRFQPTWRPTDLRKTWSLPGKFYGSKWGDSGWFQPHYKTWAADHKSPSKVSHLGEKGADSTLMRSVWLLTVSWNTQPESHRHDGSTWLEKPQRQYLAGRSSRRLNYRKVEMTQEPIDAADEINAPVDTIEACAEHVPCSPKQSTHWCLMWDNKYSSHGQSYPI